MLARRDQGIDDTVQRTPQVVDICEALDEGFLYVAVEYNDTIRLRDFQVQFDPGVQHGCKHTKRTQHDCGGTSMDGVAKSGG